MQNNAANEFSVSEAEGKKIQISQYCNDELSDITVSGDDTWRKRGHSSLNAVVRIIVSDSEKYAK